MSRKIHLILTCMLLMSLACSLGGNLISSTSGSPTSEEAPQTSATRDSSDAQIPEMPIEQRMAALQEVAAFLNTLPGEDRDENNQLAAEYLASRPEFRTPGISADGTVWAEFIDGRDFYIFNNLPLDPNEQAAQVQVSNFNLSLASHSAAPIQLAVTYERNPAAPTQALLQGSAIELPKSNQVRLMIGLGTWFDQWVEKPLRDTREMLQSHGYQVLNQEPTIDNLKSVQGDGIFILSTHGGMVTDDKYGLWTSTPIDDFNDVKYADDLDKGLMAYAIAKHNQNPSYDPDIDDLNSDYCLSEEVPCDKPYLYAHNYAITADFVEKYMFFGGNSLVVINACTSHTKSIRQAFLEKPNVTTYAGWTNEVKPDFNSNTLALFFDRLLGVNQQLPKEDPEIRPFDAVTVQTYLVEKEKHRDPWKGAVFEVSTAGSISVILTPSIQFMEVHEDSNELFIFGLFGTEEGEVWINKTKAEVVNWKSDLVVIKLRDEGAGSAGDTVVKVGDHESNTVPLTEWRGTIHYESNANNLAPNLNLEIDMDVHLRADVHASREVPWEDPQDRTIKLSLVDDSKADFKASGSSSAGGVTFEVTGAGIIPTLNEQPDHEKAHFDLFGTLEVSGRPQGKPPIIEDVNFHLHLSGDASDAKLTMKIPNMKDQVSSWEVLITDILFDQTLTFDEAYNIEGQELASGTYKGIAVLGTSKLRWDQLEAKFAPSLSKPPQAYQPVQEEGLYLAGLCLPDMFISPNYDDSACLDTGPRARFQDSTRSSVVFPSYFNSFGSWLFYTEENRYRHPWQT